YKGIEAGGIPRAKRPDIVRRCHHTDRGTRSRARRGRIDDVERVLTPGVGRAEEAGEDREPGGLVGGELDPEREMDAVEEGGLLHLAERTGRPAPSRADVIEGDPVGQ